MMNSEVARARIRVNKAHFPVTTLGYGRRVAIWLQGCTIHCSGCVNRDTWEADSQREVFLDDLLEICGPWLADADGVTVSGGEPFDQSAALAILLGELRQRMSGDLLVFSGHARETIESRWPEIVSLVDVLISDPFDGAVTQTRVLRGSDNQRISLRTALARTRYPVDIDVHKWPAGPRPMDVVVAGDQVWMAGIPERRFLTKLRAAAAARGVALSGSDLASDESLDSDIDLLS